MWIPGTFACHRNLGHRAVLHASAAHLNIRGSASRLNLGKADVEKRTGVHVAHPEVPYLRGEESAECGLISLLVDGRRVLLQREALQKERLRREATQRLVGQKLQRVCVLQIEALNGDVELLVKPGVASTSLQLLCAAWVGEGRLAVLCVGAYRFSRPHIFLVLGHAEPVGRVGHVADHRRGLDRLPEDVVDRLDPYGGVVALQLRGQDEALRLLDVELQTFVCDNGFAVEDHHEPQHLSGLVPQALSILDVCPTGTCDLDLLLGQRVSEARQVDDDIRRERNVHGRLQPHDKEEDALLDWRPVLELRDQEGTSYDARRRLDLLLVDELISIHGDSQQRIVFFQRRDRQHEARVADRTNPHHVQASDDGVPDRDRQLQLLGKWVPLARLQEATHVILIAHGRLWSGHEDCRRADRETRELESDHGACIKINVGLELEVQVRRLAGIPHGAWVTIVQDRPHEGLRNVDPLRGIQELLLRDACSGNGDSEGWVVPVGRGGELEVHVPLQEEADVLACEDVLRLRLQRQNATVVVPLAHVEEERRVLPGEHDRATAPLVEPDGRERDGRRVPEHASQLDGQCGARQDI
mmetsp:Transcript_86522/g.248211  ORF Transcript_86522/g.248211 Transcript_86522/m.248211 type:complete len:585 (+) Transcript_86522:789-2543(+)